MVSGCCCKEVYRYPNNNYYFFVLPLYYIALFWQQHPYFFVHFLNVFLFLCLFIYTCNQITFIGKTDLKNMV